MLVQIFEGQVAKTPEKIALASASGSYSYQELNNYANLVAVQILERLRGGGEANPARVGILFNHGAAMIVAMFGVLKSGHSYVPLDASYPENRLCYMLQHSQSRLVLTDNANYDLAVRIAEEAGGSIEILNMDQVDKSQVQSNPDVPVSSDQLAYILYTSGSTAKPKGVMQTHRNIWHFITCYRDVLQIHAGDRLTLFSSFSHDAAVMDIYGALLNGATLYPLDIKKELSLNHLASWLRTNAITIWHSVPTLYRYFTNILEQEVELPDLRLLVLGGEAVRRRDLELFQKLFPKATLYNLYGQTESSYNAGEFFTPNQQLDKLTLGQVVDETEIFVVDEDGNVVDPLETGEIVVASRYLSPGYWYDEVASAKVFLPSESFGGIYRTGDLGKLLLDGRIEFAGRKDFQLKIRGFRVEPGEIESVLLKHPCVQEAIVQALENQHGDPYLCAYLQTREVTTPAELREYLARELPEYMVPAHYLFLPEMPLTPNGKINRKALPEPGSLMQVSKDTYAPPTSELEVLIARLWQEELGLEKVGVKDQFFDLGGNSLGLIMLNTKLNKLLKLDIPVVKMFEFPTVSSLANYVSQLLTDGQDNKHVQPLRKERARTVRHEIAVIGLSGRFPGARNVSEFWENLKNGVESISFFSDEELREAGIEPELLQNRDYIKAKGVLDDLEYFDAEFFDYLPADARLMDPQTRIFHECVWEALEDAGYDPSSYEGLIGLFAGAASNLQWEALSLLAGSTDTAGQFSARQLYDKDFLSTRISYKLNLKGPSYVVQTACSTSLAAIDLGCQSLLAGNCDLALAGGISILLPKKAGYLYQEGMIFSKDGHCRAFDAAASGTVAGDGCGVVALKRLEDALRDGDNIYAVIKGSASNNDGLRKVGFTAPSVEGQVEVIRTAHALAGVEPDLIGYVETHGTGTVLGDPIEVESLRQAFLTERKGYCALGAVKTNIGHLGVAAGVAGFIKTVLALKEKVLPPTLHFTAPNPKIDFVDTPFYVNTQCMKWESPGVPRCAGVSSFGIGGTNIHMILEEAPEVQRSEQAVGDYIQTNEDVRMIPAAGPGTRAVGLPAGQDLLLVVSARTESALQKLQDNLLEHVQNSGQFAEPAGLANLAYTLQVGRKAFACRRAVVLRSREDVLKALVEENAHSGVRGNVQALNPRMWMVLQGELEEALEAGQALYRNCVEVQKEFEHCLAIASTVCGVDLLKRFQAVEPLRLDLAASQNQEISALILFSLQYAVIQWFERLRIRPEALIGYGVGQYVLGSIAGVFNLEDGLRLTWLAARGGLQANELAQLANNLEHGNVHLQSIRDALERIALKPPALSFNSSLTGHWITPAEACDPNYWVTCAGRDRELRAENLAETEAIFLQLGSGTVIARADAVETRQRIDLAITPSFTRADLLTVLGNLWVRGVEVHWQALQTAVGCRRISLPAYPFERQRFWFEDDRLNHLLNLNTTTNLNQSLSLAKEQRKELSSWFYTPVWERSLPVTKGADNGRPWLVFCGESALARYLTADLKNLHPELITVSPGSRFDRVSETAYRINPALETDYTVLLASLKRTERIPERVIHLWSLESGPEAFSERLAQVKDTGFYSLLYFVRALGKVGSHAELKLEVVSSNMQEVVGGDLLYPEKALLLGVVQNIPMEYLQITCRSIDLDLRENVCQPIDRLCKTLAVELSGAAEDQVVAYRGNYRWVQNWQPSRLEAQSVLERLTPGGTYLITGGTGGIGLALAETIGRSVPVTLILTGRSAFPAREVWDAILTDESKPELQDKIRTLCALEDAGAKVHVYEADVASKVEMQQVVEKVLTAYGRIDGVIHSAGIADYAGAVQRAERSELEKIFAAKVDGTWILRDLLADQELDFFLLCSSLWSILPSFGQVGYCAANSFLDAFANYLTGSNGVYATSINWDTWQEVGMSYQAVHRLQKNEDLLAGQEKLQKGLLTTEGQEAFRRILGGGLAQIAVSSRDLATRLREIKAYREEGKRKLLGDGMTNARGLSRTVSLEEIRKTLIEMWKEILALGTVQPADDFFELGGDSLKAITFTARINREWNVKVPLEEVFTHPTVEMLAGYIYAVLGAESRQEDTGDRALFAERQPDLVNRHLPFPLTGVQKAYLVGRSDLYDLGGVSTHSYSEFQQEVDLERLNRSFNKVIRRHAMLRAIIREDGQQLILRDVPEYEIAVCDLRGLSEAEQEAQIRIERERMSHHVFLTDEWPLFEIRAFRLRDGLYHFCAGFDLLILDASSFELLSRDLLYFYEHPEEELPELEFTFRDYVLAAQQLKESAQYELDKRYWLERVPDFPTAPALPLICQPSEVQKPHFERLKQVYSREELTALRELAAAENLTVSALLCTAYAEVLGYWSNQTNLALNLSVFNRYPFHPDVNKLIGDFTSIILLNIQLEPQRSLVERAKLVQTSLLEALEHRLYDGVELIRELARFHELGTQAAMPVVFTSTTGNRETLGSEQKVKLVDATTGISQTSQVFLDNKVSELDGELVVLWDYCADLFAVDVIQEMFYQYNGILRSLLTGVAYRLTPSKADILQIAQYNETGEAIPATTIDRLCALQVQRTPDGIAVREGNEAITFAELDCRSSQVAAYLQEQGIRQGDCVAVLASRRIGTIVNLLGIIKAGAAYVPIDPDYPVERQQYIRENSACKLLVTHTLYTDAKLANYPAIAGGSALPSDLAYVIYTSGSTGRPKGVMITHEAVCNTIIDINQKFEVTAIDRIMGISSMCFDLSVYDIFGALSTGATLVLIEDQRDARALVRTVAEQGITFWNSVPAIMDMALEELSMAEVDGTLIRSDRGESLRVVLLSGDWIPLKLPAKIRKYYPNAQVISLGGATEASIWSIYYPVQEVETKWKSIPYGFPLANQQFYVLNVEQGLSPVGVRGELYIGGVGVAAGYRNDPEKTAQAFIEHPELGRLYRTGDYGKMTSQGYIEFLGRVDSQVKIRGYRIELGEIEARLLEYPGIRTAVVIDRVSSAGKKYLAAYIVATNPWTVAELRKHLGETLPEYMIPAYFLSIAELPLTPNGKVNRHALPEPTESRSEETTITLPQSPVQAKLLEIWQELLQVELIGVEENFFELGGDSLKIQQLANRIARHFAVDMPLKTIFVNPTIAQIAICIEAALGVDTANAPNLKYADKSADVAAQNQPFPLTNIQKAYLVGRSDQFDLGGVSTHSYAEFKRRIDLERLEMSFNRLIQRHGMLRAIIHDNGTQQILAEVPFYRIAVEDVSQLSTLEQEKRILDERERMSHHVFRTDRWPLFEIKAFLLEAGLYYFCVGFDLLIMDASSSRILGKEFFAFFQNPDLTLPELEFTFRDYVVAYEELKGSAHYQRDKEYWLNQLAEFPQAPALPLRCNPSEVKEPHFQRKELRFSPDDSRRLKEFAQAHGMTISVALCTAYAQVLSYWSSQTSLAINVSLFNRYPFHPDVDQLMGDFTSVILLGLRLPQRSDFCAKARVVQEVLIEALEHRLYDGVELIRELTRYHNLGTQAAMPVVFTSIIGNRDEEVHLDELAPGEERMSGAHMGISQTSQVFLDNQVSEVDGEIKIVWDYVADLFDENVISQMFTQYIGILQACIIDQEYRLSPSDADLALIAAYNHTGEAIIPTTLARLFALQVQRVPQQIALRESESTLTYAELDQRSTQVAHYLRAMGTRSGDFVGLLASRRTGTIVNMLGIIKVGAIYVPVDPEYPAERQAYILENSACKLVLASDLYETAGLTSYAETGSWEENHPEDLAYVIYTSGSTGRPKGVMITHGAVTNTLIDINQKFRVTEADRILGISSMCFDLSVYDIFGALSTGATLVLIEDQRDARALVEAVEKYGITFWNSVPAIMDMALEELAVRPRQGASLRLVLLSGDWIPLKLPEKIWKHYPHAEVISLGGATEASIWSIYYPVQAVDAHWKSIPYGRPLANQMFYVMDAEQTLCPAGVRGELYIGGVGVAAGYLNDPEKTAHAFSEHPEWGRLYRTGDYGRLLADGTIEFLGRVDAQVKIRGYRIELGEIESRLLEYPGIRNAVVIDRPGDNGKKYLAAYIVTPEPWTVAELRAHLMQTLPDYMVPAYFVEVPEIPLTPNGKVDRRALPEPAESRNLTDTYIAPRNAVEERLVQIWCELLSVDEIGVEDNFFDLGGDSLKIQHLVNAIAKEFHVQVKLRDIFVQPTVAKIGEVLMQNAGAGAWEYAAAAHVRGMEVRSGEFVDPHGASGRPGQSAMGGAFALTQSAAAGSHQQRYFWSPVQHWQMQGDAVQIGDTLYGGVAVAVFPELYFYSQKGMTLGELAGRFPTVAPVELAALLTELVRTRVLVDSVLPIAEALAPQNRLYQSKYGEEIYYDAVAYNQFKHDQLNRVYDDYPARDRILLQSELAYDRVLSERKSYREFDETRPVPFESFAHLISTLRQIRDGESIRYYYASAGGLYPIDIYIYVKPDRVEHVEAGLYYYDPRENSLLLLDESAQISGQAYGYGNKSIFTSAAFSIYMLYNADVSMPKYGSMGYVYACVDSGIMVGTLTQVAETQKIGLCSIGTMNFESIRRFFGLKPTQLFIHAIELGLKPGSAEPLQRDLTIPVVAEEEYYPLTAAQKRMYIVNQFETSSTSYNNPTAVCLQGRVEYAKIQDIFQQLVMRHDALRTYFTVVQGEPVQKVQQIVDFQLTLHKCREDEMLEFIQNFIRPFDLAAAPLFRAALIQLAEERHLLIFDLHHIISDGTSILVLIREFGQLYQGQTLLPLRIQYKDFAAWQRKMLASEALQVQEHYWLQQFVGGIPVLELPLDYPRPAMQSFAGRTLEFLLDQELSERLRDLALKNNATLFMVLLATYNTILYRYSGQEDLVVGSPIAGRPHADLRYIVGMFVNTLALRSQPVGTKSFDQYLAEVKEICLKAYEHQDYQFEELVSKLDIPRDLSRNPLFDTMFVLQNMDIFAGQLTDLQILPFEYEHPVAKFDLTLTATEVQGQIRFTLQYCSKLFAPETMERWSRHWQNLLQAVTRTPEMRLSELEMLSAAEKHQLLVEFNTTMAELPKAQTVQQLFEEQVALTPERVAVEYTHAGQVRQLTYRELNKQANRLAGVLQKRGFRKEQIAALLLDRSLELVVGVLAILKAGGAYLPVEATYPAQRIQYMLESSQATILLSRQTLREATGIPFEEYGWMQCLDLDEAFTDAGNSANLVTGTGPTDLAYVIYTSGSTGKPKGVQVEHQGVVNYLTWAKKVYAQGEDCSMPLYSSLSFDLTVTSLYLPLITGSRVLIYGDEPIAELLQAILRDERVRALKLTPAHLQLVKELEVGECTIRRLIVGGEELKGELARAIDAAFGGRVEIYNEYGPTEATVGCMVHRYNPQEDLRSSVSIGVPADQMQIYLLDAYQQPVPTGVVGEIYIGGVGVARGYLRQPELTAEKFMANPYRPGGKLYRTGDLARRLTNGKLEYLGRVDQQVKVRGYRIEPGEIEAALLQMRRVTAAVVLVKENPGGERTLWAYLVCTEHTETRDERVEAEIRAGLANLLPEYMIPAQFVFLDHLPVTSNGKIDRNALRGRSEILRSGATYAPPTTELERRLAVFWAELLYVEQVGIDDNFFKLGGQSLKATQMLLWVKKEYGVDVPLRTVFAEGTIRELARYISTAATLVAPELKAQSVRENYPTSSAQKRLYIIQEMSGGIEYNLPQVVILPSTPDIERLQWAVNALLERHESLRTTFHLMEGEPVQRVQGTVTCEIGKRNLVREEVTEVLHQLIRPFDLSTAPLLRVELLQLEEETLLFLDMHHIIADGMALQILVRELMALYSGEELPELSIQYRDFAVWQQQLWESGTMQVQEDFWLETFAGEIPVFEMPADFLRPALKDFSGELCTYTFPADLTAALQELALEHGATLYMVLLAGVNILLSQYTGQEDLVVGSPIAGRSHYDLQNLIGMFVNTLALRNQPDGELTFVSFLAQVREHTIQAYENQDYPFEMLVDHLQLPRRANHNPLFDVMFVLQNTLDRAEEVTTALAYRPYAWTNPVTRFDLTFNVQESRGELLWNLEYATSLFSRPTVERMLRHLQQIFSEVVQHPVIQLKEIALLSLAEEQMLCEWNNTAVDVPANLTVLHMFAEQVRKTPERIAVSLETESLTYRELGDYAVRVAAQLRATGVRENTVVALCAERSLEMVGGMLGIMLADGVYLPLGVDHPAERIQYLQKDSGASIILTQPHLQERCSVSQPGPTVMLLEPASSGEVSSELREVDEQLAAWCAECKPSQLAYIIYTSGTTGQPKGVLVEHGQIANTIWWRKNEYALQENDRALQLFSYLFDGFFTSFLTPLVSGAESVFLTEMGARDLQVIQTTIRTKQITHLLIVPSLYALLLSTLTDADAGSLRVVTLAGERVSASLTAETRARFAHVELVNEYGPTEASVAVTYMRNVQSAEVVTIGRPIANMRITVKDRYGRSVPVGVPGELWIGGPGVAHGYLNRPALSREKFIPDLQQGGGQLYRSGDLARWRAEGTLEFLGRLDQQIKLRGYRIEPGEIEQQLLHQPGITAAVVVVRESCHGADLVGYYVAREALAVTQVRNALSAKLPAYMVPDYLVQLDTLPRSTNGKIDYRGLPAPTLDWRKPGEQEQPVSVIEQELVQIWAKVLDLEPSAIGVDDAFFELGGNSLKLIKLNQEIHQRFGSELKVADYFDLTTIRRLGEYLEQVAVTGTDEEIGEYVL